MEPSEISEEDRLAVENADLRVQLAVAQRAVAVQTVWAKYGMGPNDSLKGRDIVRPAKLESVPADQHAGS
jgi:hypothetical protein